MKDNERKKVQNNNQTRRPVRTPRKEGKIGEENGRKPLTKLETQSKALRSRPVSNTVASETSVGPDLSQAYEDVVIHYIDENSNRSADVQLAKGEDSDYESVKDSSSSQGDSLVGDDEKLERDSSVLMKMSKKGSLRNNSGVKDFQPSLNKTLKSNNVKVLTKPGSEDSKSASMKKEHPLKEEEKDEDLFEEASNGGKSTESDDEMEMVDLKQKVEIMENRVEKLEEELREVAALEISLYSVIPEHGSSAHKVHTPARRLSRLYIHACKHWTRSKRATIARNTVSGIVLVTRTCGNDLPRLTFWLSTTIVLREIISQEFGISSTSVKQMNRTSQSVKDWEETSTFTSALEKIESWIFSRAVESVWWQALTPNMLSPVEELISEKSVGKLWGPALGDAQQGNFSIELWKTAFQTAFQRLCPARASGHDCGCLPVLSRMVMEQCIARLDVAMFNAILRESASQIPTDPISDPIVDSRVLPIPAGEFSFGSGAQLKNAVGNWSRWFEGALGVEVGHPSKGHDSEAYDDRHRLRTKTKCFRLLNELADLLMLPKDLLMDNSIREEVCPSIKLAVIKRVLCYFTPDEFCPDQVPGDVLESLNAETPAERKLAEGSFPYAASTVLYCPPPAKDVSVKVGELELTPQLDRNVSMVQKKGYTSDDDLDDLDSPLTSLIELASPSTVVNGKSSLKDKEATGYRGNARYDLLREVWSL